MCLIVDNSVAGAILGKKSSELAGPVWDWLLQRGGRLVYGGYLKQELIDNHEVRRALTALLQAGRAFLVPAGEVAGEEEKIANNCCSNDAHVIALARVSGARVLCADDSKLESDFKDKRLVNNPRGKVLKHARHKSILRHHKSCGLEKRGK